MRRAWLPWSLVVLVGAVAPLACGQAFEATGSSGAGGAATGTASGDPPTTTVTTTSGGGSGSTTASTTTSVSSGSGGCMKASDCTAPTTLCGEAACFNGKCGLKALHTGKTDSQFYGDCHTFMCTNAQLVHDVDDTDLYDDANDCTEDLCTGGVPSNMLRPMGFACNNGKGKVCDAKGACVQCVSNSDCSDGLLCHEGACVPLSCYDTAFTSVTGETDTDCGGKMCEPCGDTKLCLQDTDCKSGLCRKPVGQGAFKCITPTCVDHVKNGTETAKDCGGPDCSDRCSTGDTCLVPGDCMSGVCVSGKCQQASCTDGVKNGNEDGVDCGAACPACLPGSGG